VQISRALWKNLRSLDDAFADRIVSYGFVAAHIKMPASELLLVICGRERPSGE
jgi:hypothetical protein